MAPPVTTFVVNHAPSLTAKSPDSSNSLDQEKSMAQVSNVVVSDCEKLDDTCPFVRGFNKTIELDFTTSK